MMIALYAFTLPWINFAILQRYFLQKDQWGDALPGLDTTPYRKFTMRGHMATGAICLILGPLQFIPQLRSFYPKIHRWSGRIYCSCAMLSCCFGLIFIALKGQLVGGWNMTVAFSCAGVTIGVLGFKAWQTARAAKVSASSSAGSSTTGTLDFTAHRNWGIRSYSQILAPMLYRYWYICLQLFGLYRVPVPPRLGGVCRNDIDICPDYLRIIDMMHCWTYWLTALGVAELIIYYLPKHHRTTCSGSNTADGDDLMVAEGEEESSEMERPFLSSRTPSSPSPPCDNNDDDNDDEPPRPIRSPSPTAVNVIGWILALTTVTITTRLFTYSRGP